MGLLQPNSTVEDFVVRASFLFKKGVHLLCGACWQTIFFILLFFTRLMNTCDMQRENIILEILFWPTQYVFGDIYFVDAIVFQNTIYETLCLMFLCFGTDYRNLCLEKASSGESVYFPFSDENQLLTEVNYIFTFFFYACDE